MTKHNHDEGLLDGGLWKAWNQAEPNLEPSTIMMKDCAIMSGSQVEPNLDPSQILMKTVRNQLEPNPEPSTNTMEHCGMMACGKAGTKLNQTRNQAQSR